MPAAINITGQRFGRLVALSPTDRRKQGHILWRCQCDCGNITEKPVAFLRNGLIRSCGCLNKDTIRAISKLEKTKKAVSAATIKRNLKHGQARRGKTTRTWRIWIGLPLRRYSYKYATPICERWQNFKNFLEDMGPCPSPKHTIDRLDNSKGYEPGNCRWATMKQQQNNRTNNRRITFAGRTLTLQQWADETGFARETIARRLDRLGWPIEKALTKAPRRRHR